MPSSTQRRTPASSTSPSGAPRELKFFYNEFSGPSRKVLIALYEKKAVFEKKNMDLFGGEQFSPWFLDLNPRGEVPVLKHGSEVVVESTQILEYVDKNFGRPYLLFPHENANVHRFIRMIDSIPMFVLTFGIACYHAPGITEVLRFPYCTDKIQKDWKKKLAERPNSLRAQSERAGGEATEAGRVLAEKAISASDILDVFHTRSRLLSLLSHVESILDEIETELSDPDDKRVGPWLCGPIFSAADITLTALLVRLYQLGLDDQLWKGGRRPNLAVYQELAFRRPSVEKATNMKEHSGKTLSIPPFTGETTSASASAAGQNLSGRSETTNRGPNITISGNGSSSADSPFSYGVSGSDSTENLVNFYNRERSQPRDEDSMSISSISSIASVEAARVGLGAVLVIGGIYACRKLIGK